MAISMLFGYNLYQMNNATLLISVPQLFFRLFMVGLFFMVFASGCETDVPFLEMSALDTYTAPDVVIPYVFSAESDVHDARCVLEILETTGGGAGVFVYFDEFTRRLQREGVFRAEISTTGYYRLTVTLLSSRGTLRKELKFASDTVEFEVVP